jgi:SAM-dependent methyltransferase
MTFRELITFWEQLQTVSSVDVRNHVLQELSQVMFVAQRSSGAIDTEFLQLKHQEIITGLADFEQILTELKRQIKNRVEDEEKEWFRRSSQWYRSELDLKLSQHPDFPKQLRNRQVELDPATETLFVARILQHNDWHYPGMIIHPGEEPFMQYMVGTDPLYLVDESHALLDLVNLSNYNEIYQKRLRKYVIEESFNRDILEKIPNEQFGICLAYHYFDFRPIEMIEKYLIEIYQKLRPGGTLIMTFNDCDRPAGVILVENNYASYNRAPIIKNLAERLNYSVEFFYHEHDSPMSWIELRRPGTLTSLRGGQTQAKIIPNPVANSK